MKNQTAESNRTNEIVAEGFGLEISIPKADATAVVPLNYQKAFASFPEAEKQEVMALSNSIDLTKIDNVMNYGAAPFINTFQQCREFLKKERGSSADQAVIKEVIELSKKVTEINEEFNTILKEPNTLQKIFLKAFLGNKKSSVQKIKNYATTAYDLIGQLKSSYSSWLETLKDGMEEIGYSAVSDIEAIKLLEKYIIAGKIAESRLKDELEQAETEANETGLISVEYEKIKEGYDIFCRRMGHLEDARIMYRLSLAEVMLVGKSNRNMQEAIKTQEQITSTFIELQIRNAMLNEKVKEVLEGHKAITKLGNELVKEISKNIGRTAEETEELIYASIYDPEAGKEAIENVLKSCEVIKNTETEMLPKLKAAREQNNELIKKLEPIVNSAVNSTQTLKIESQNTSSTKSIETKLKF
ncbi:MAG: hypothetical protein HFJ42_08620 [Clostridia bacterium]|nr:hypothetical protein [Clostridia bacterium]